MFVCLAVGQVYDLDRDYVPPASSPPGASSQNTNPNSDTGNLGTEIGQIEGEIEEIESEINAMENANDNNGNSNSNSNAIPSENSQGNVDVGIFPESSIIDYEHVINHVTKHYKKNKFIIWIVLGIAGFLALFACPSWIACCVGYYCYRRRQNAKLQEKFNYDATSDSDEETGKTTSDSLVRKLTMVSRKRRHTQQRKGAYEPLKSAEEI